MLQAGKFNCKLIIEQQQVGKDASGGMNRTWVAVTPELWATRTSRSGNEVRVTASAGGTAGVAREEFLLYWRPGIHSGMRVRSGGRLFNIVHANDTAVQGKALVLTCDTGVNDG